MAGAPRPVVREPIGVMWKTVSEDCNLACDYCYYSTVAGKPGREIRRIDPHVLEKFIREYMAISNGVASFAWQGGEPLLAGLDFFRQVVSLQARYAPPHTAISNALQTNGTLIGREWAEFFHTYRFLLGVSLDGPQPIHDARRVTGSGKGSFEAVMRGISHLRAAKVDFNILTVVHDGNVGQAGAMMEFFSRERFDYVQFIPCMDFRSQRPDQPGKYLITTRQYGDFLCEAFDVWYNGGSPQVSERFFDNTLSVYLNREAELCIHRSKCPKTLILEQNGDAYPCDFYIHPDYKIGNVGVDPLEDILASPLYGRFLDMKPDLPEKCQACPYLKLCYGGCPRNRAKLPGQEKSGVDYFCESYKQFYAYADGRLQELADRLRAGWLRQYKESGRKMPGRNEPCFCGSGKKYKACCGRHTAGGIV